MVKIVAEDYKHGFLEPEERAFLDYVVQKHSLDYLNWCHRTRALKSEIAEIKAKSAAKQEKKSKYVKVTQLPLFPEMEQKKSPIHIPIALMKRPTFKKWLRIA